MDRKKQQGTIISIKPKDDINDLIGTVNYVIDIRKQLGSRSFDVDPKFGQLEELWHPGLGPHGQVEWKRPLVSTYSLLRILLELLRVCSLDYINSF